MSKAKRIGMILFGIAVTSGFGLIFTDNYFIYAPAGMAVIMIPAMWLWMSPD